jgi:serine/threonine protein kinase
MNDPRWFRVEELFHQAMALPPERRRQFLQLQCPNEPRILEAVLKLLNVSPAADKRFEQPIDPPAFLLDPKSPSPSVSSLQGTLLGPWRLLQPLAAGGMGAVWIAERADGQFTMAAAVKLLRRGFDTEDARRRFMAERQILASLQHPSIARLLDGGISADGLPYLVMELIDGRPLDAHSSANRLDVNDRLGLFLRVCEAVRFAHSHLVVHRDLKPQNILVTAKGEVKLLDFGIAKLLDQAPSSEQTSATSLMLTPRYASPEQVMGLSISTQSDVYSLGVILYELLTGSSPYSSTQHTAAEWYKAINDEESPPPSRKVADPALSNALAGDLDSIVQKALEKNPADRYRSVEHLDSDIARYLAGQPITARPQTLAYRASKFARRHALPVAASISALVLLIAAFAITFYQYRVAARERELAQRRFTQVRELARLSLFDLYDVIQQTPGTTNAQRLLVSKTLEHYKRLAAQSQGDPELLSEVASGYCRLGDLQGNPYMPNLGDPSAAIETYRQGLSLLAPFAERTGPTHLELARARLLGSLGDVVSLSGSAADSIKYLRQAESILQAVRESAPRDTAIQAELCSRRESIADRLAGVGSGAAADEAGAILAYESARVGWLEMLNWPNLSAEMRARASRADAVVLMKLGNVDMAQQRYPMAVARYRDARTAISKLDRTTRASLTTIRAQVMILRGEGFALLWSGKPAEALPIFTEGLALSRQLLAGDPQNEQHQSSVMTLLTAHGDALEGLNRRPDAAAAWREAEHIGIAQLARNPSNAVAKTRLEDLRAKIAAQ